MAGQNSSILGVCDILGLPRPEYLEYENSQSDYQQAGVLTILLQYYWSQNNNTIIEGVIQL